MHNIAYNHVLGDIPSCTYLPHHYFPNHNLVDWETLNNFSEDLNNFEDNDFLNFNENEDLSIIEDENFKKDKFLSNFPCYKPFEYEVGGTMAFYCGSGLSNVARDVLKQKRRWERKLNEMKVKNPDKAFKSVKDVMEIEEHKISKDMKMLIKHFNSDPEPSFEGSYNWLYSGGNLVKVQPCNQDFLIHADYSNGYSNFSIATLNNTLDQIDFKTYHQTKVNSPILQICSKCKGDDILVFVRQRKNATLYSFKADELTSLRRLWRKKIRNLKLLTSLDVNSNFKEVLITDSNRDIHVFDIEAKTKTAQFSFNKLKLKDIYSDAWNQTLFGNHGLYAGFRKHFLILDPRDNVAKAKLEYFPDEEVNSCEELCSIQCSASDTNYLYLGTTHHLVQMDLRCGKTVQCWTHLMKNRPQFIECIQENNKEVVVLQSHKIGETLGTTNDYEGDEEEKKFISRSNLCLLNGVKRSVKLARFNGLCLNPHLVRRFDFDVTGIQCLKNTKEGIHLFIANSGGDVFLSELKNKELLDLEIEENITSERILNSMEKYELNFERLSPSQKYQNLDMVDMDHVLKDLKRAKVKPYFKKSELEWNCHERYAPENLIFFRDYLAEKILKVWKFKTETMSIDDPIVSSHAKVQEWIDKM